MEYTTLTLKVYLIPWVKEKGKGCKLKFDSGCWEYHLNVYMCTHCNVVHHGN